MADNKKNEKQPVITPLVESSSSVNPTMTEFLQEMAAEAIKREKEKQNKK